MTALGGGRPLASGRPSRLYFLFRWYARLYERRRSRRVVTRMRSQLRMERNSLLLTRTVSRPLPQSTLDRAPAAAALMSSFPAPARIRSRPFPPIM